MKGPLVPLGHVHGLRSDYERLIGRVRPATRVTNARSFLQVYVKDVVFILCVAGCSETRQMRVQCSSTRTALVLVCVRGSGAWTLHHKPVPPDTYTDSKTLQPLGLAVYVRQFVPTAAAGTGALV
jgi:hypothetical protein